MMKFVELGDVIKEKGIYVGTVNGKSMFPMLRNKKDTVIIRPFAGKLKKYDVVLYRKRNMYVLHRIVRKKFLKALFQVMHIISTFKMQCIMPVKW